MTSSSIPVLTFTHDGQVIQEGNLVEDRPFQLMYDSRRLSQCRATYNGLPVWGIAVMLRYWPGGVVFEEGWSGGKVGPDGFFPPLVLRLPLGATRLELWFKNTDRAGCVSWDSQSGANYSFPIVPKPSDDA